MPGITFARRALIAVDALPVVLSDSKMLLTSLRSGVVVAALVSGVGCNSTVVVASGSGTTTDTGGGGAAGSTTTGSTTTGTGGAGGTTGTGGSVDLGCSIDFDCNDDPGGPLCNTETGQCVSCLVADTPELDCGIGQWCNPLSGQCQVGCTGDVDCPSNGAPLTCDLGEHACVGCLNDDTCPIGAICVTGTCVPGCNPNHPCQAGFACCGQQCFNPSSDANNCGGCNIVCPMLPNSLPVCQNGSCLGPDCTPGFANCDGNTFNGCEHNVIADGPCACLPGSTESCYQGSPGTEDVGPCHAGQRACNFQGTGWGACTGQVLPVAEACANAVDDNCNGAVDETPDADLDGWTSCEGDCNDADPLVNPGALEITYQLVDDDNNPGTPPILVDGVGNGKDDDCNPATPDVGFQPSCSAAALNTGVTALDLARALELCDTAIAGAPKPQRTWGLVSASLLRVDGTAPSPAQLAALQSSQTAVLAGYGMYAPKKGATMVGMSTGKMRAPGEAGYVSPLPGTDFGWTGSPPAQYVAAHGGVLPSISTCNGLCTGGSGANDGALLRLAIRTPTNMTSFTYSAAFLSAEYPFNVCTIRSDNLLAMYTSNVQGIPLDHNVVFDAQGNPLAAGTAYFDVCEPSGCYPCSSGSAGLAGTGMPGGTSWLLEDVPFVPGETITLDFTLFDVSDGGGDSVALLDAFRWNHFQPCMACP